MTADPQERRRRSRVPVRLEVTIIQEGEEIPVRSRDLSLKGLSCSPDPRLQVHSCCQVVVALVPEIRVVIKGRVVRGDDRGAAVDFLDMDPDSFTRLHRIVSWHAPEPEAITRELLTPAFPLSRPRGVIVTGKRFGRKK
jgi:hypothetical protein